MVCTMVVKATVIKHLGVLSVAKIGAIFGLIWGLIYGIIIAIAGGTFLSALGLGALGLAGLGAAIIVIMLILGGILGFIIAAIYAFIYNLSAGGIGGIEVDLEIPE
jgi:hypothetical protein